MTELTNNKIITHHGNGLLRDGPAETYPSRHWTISLNDPWFDLVRTGKKTYEGRCNWKNARMYRVGDTLTIQQHTDITRESYDVIILERLEFPTFLDALNTLDLKSILPNVSSIEEGDMIYQKYVSKETQKEYGVVMFHIRRI